MAEEKYFIYRLQPTRSDMLALGTTPEEEAVIDEHFAYLSDLTEQGIVLLAGRTLNTDTSSFGIVILKTESEETANQIMHFDPAVAQGVMRAEIHPFKIALCSGDICE